ncbi:Helix-turn-helix domain (plasmid) [Rubrobacter radiotolerans]|nr:Helix-turn-helix domain [Rubrobacter radiotolerans]
MRGRRGDGLPIYTYEAVPGVPPVSITRLGRRSSEPLPPGAHSHDFLVLDYFERGGGSVRLEDRRWSVEAGDVYIIAPGEIGDLGGLEGAEGWAVLFPPEVLGAQVPGAFLSWRSHPLLFPFVGGAAGGVQRLKVPPEERSSWSERFSALDLELRLRRDGYKEAVLAHLTLSLVGVGRLVSDVVEDLRLKNEPLLAEVFRFIEECYGEPISLKDVARAVSLTPGHLTTVVRRKTGRTVLEWISERRMVEARRLLVETDRSVEEIGRACGHTDPAYFVRTFRRAHGVTPLGWRRAGRP